MEVRRGTWVIGWACLRLGYAINRFKVGTYIPVLWQGWLEREWEVGTSGVRARRKTEAMGRRCADRGFGYVFGAVSSCFAWG